MVQVSFPSLSERSTGSSHSHWTDEYTFRVLPQGNGNSPTLWQNLLRKSVYFLDIFQNKALGRYINNVMLIRPNEQEMEVH